jgi:4-amino-4-deoxy-L-arabinose transferase-like glycosyltransferase
MINFGFDITSLLGLFDLILAIAIFVMTLSLILGGRGTQPRNPIGFYIAQLFLVPLPLLLAGAIFLFRGWRLDPILQIAVLCLHLIIIFQVVKDFYVYRDR